MSALSAPNSPKDKEILYGILGSHPRLGRPPVPETGPLSELSKKEQAQLNTGAEEQAERLKAMNAEYEARFPGLRFVYVIPTSRFFDVVGKFQNWHNIANSSYLERSSTVATEMSSWRRCARGSIGAIQIVRSRRLFRCAFPVTVMVFICILIFFDRACAISPKTAQRSCNYHGYKPMLDGISSHDRYQPARWRTGYVSVAQY